jgi:hypothetical protein
MKKIMIVIALIALLSLSAIAIGTYKTPIVSERKYGTGGVQRVTHYDPRVNYQRIRTIIALSPPGPDVHPGVGRGGVAPMYSRGTAEISSVTWYGYPRSHVLIKTKDILPSYENNAQYEVWLVDVESGYRLSMGVFTTGFGGVGSLDYHIDKNLDPYDFVEITVEPFDDLDVSPGPVMLIGAITAANYFNPPSKSAKMITPPTIKDYT